MSSKDYWEKREAENLKHCITEEKEFDKRLNEIYSDMLEKVQDEINAFYGKYAAKEGISISEAKKRVSQLDIKRYERKAKRYVKEKDFSAEANEEMRLYNLTMKVNRLEMLKANIGLELISGHNELQKFFESILKGRTEAELKRQAGILGKTVTNNARTARVIVNASFHNAKFSNRIWLYQDLLKAEIDKLLQSGMIQGKNPRVLAKELQKKFGVSQYNAERLMRTELARVQTDAQKESFIRNGFDMYTFHVNGGCCPICEAISGKHFKVKDMMPGKNAPPMHPHCRCSTSAYENSDDYEAWLDFLDKGGTTEEWNKLKGKAFELKQTTKITKKVHSSEYAVVDREFVNSKVFHDKYEGLTKHKAVNEILYQESMKILEHRDGTAFEDVVVIDSRTGKIVESVTEHNEVGKVKITAEQYGKISGYDGKITLLHNHPNSGRPSYTDIVRLKDSNIDTVVAVGHDGTVYKASNLNPKVDIEKIYNELYNEFKQIVGDDVLSEHYATDALYDMDIFDVERR